MNPKLQPIFNRRSIRKFTSEPVSPEQVRELLEAAMAAPSAVSSDPWDFVVVRSRERLDAAADVLPHGKMLHEAPLGILVAGSPERANRNLESYLLQDCCAAIENLLLAASMLGLGAVWLGVHPTPDRMEGLTRIFELPPDTVPVAMIAIGHPDESKPPRTRYREDFVHQETWRNPATSQ